METPFKPVSTLALLLALAAMPQASVASPRFMPLLAQATLAQAVFPFPDSVPSGTTIKLESSSTLAGINEVLEQRFENQFSGTDVNVNYTNSDAALAALDRGEIDIAAIGRPLTDTEKSAGYQEIVLARHKIAIVVSDANPFLGDVTTIEFSQLFRGEISDWSGLAAGGAPGPIRFIDRPGSSDTRQALSAYPVFQSAPFATGDNAEVLGDDSTQAMIEALGTDGMGYAIADQVVNQPGVRIVAMHQVLPTDPLYPFSQPLSYVYKGEASPAVQAFLGYATTPNTAQILEQAKTLGATATLGGLQGTPNLEATALASLVDTADAPATDPSQATTDPTASDPATADGATDPTAGVVPAPLEPNASDSEATATTQGETSDATGDETTTAQDGFPWWLLWILGIPLLGTLFWLFFRGKEDDGEVSPIAGVEPSELDLDPTASSDPLVAAGGAVAAGTVAPGGAFFPSEGQMVLVPRNPQSADAQWEIPESYLAELRDQGGEEFVLRLYDVTDRYEDENLPKPLQQLECNPEDTDRHLAIPATDRDYVAEIGYLTAGQRWLPAARSEPTYIPANLSDFPPESASPFEEGQPFPDEDDSITPPAEPDLTDDRFPDAGDAIGTVTATGTAAVAAGMAAASGQVGKVMSRNVPRKDRLTLVPQGGREAYIAWEVPDQKKAELRQKGGEKLALRLYDVTGIDPRTQKPHSVQQFECDENDTNLRITVPTADRSYLADLGYITSHGKWLRLAHSSPVQVPTGPTGGPDGEGGVEASLRGADGLGLGGMMDGIEAKANDAVQFGQNVADATQTGASQLGQTMASSGAAAAAGAAAMATAGVTAATAATGFGANHGQGPQIIMVPRVGGAAYVYWEIPDAILTELSQKGIQSLSLRIHEVTNIDLNHSPAHSTQTFICDLKERDRHISIDSPDKDYLAELGYMTADGSWLGLARSVHVRVPSAG